AITARCYLDVYIPVQHHAFSRVPLMVIILVAALTLLIEVMMMGVDMVRAIGVIDGR
ncbi:unnamed protein product, partial [Prorocentrum cordatum]